MKALTLHQPWASLIADGRKTIETRAWSLKRALVGERIAIHAGKKIDGAHADKWYAGHPVPVGAILCTARIDGFGCVKRSEAGWATLAWWYGREELDRLPIDEFGDFSPGRYLWKLAEVEAVVPIARISGRQRLWDWVM